MKKITKKEFVGLYQSMKLKELAKYLGIAETTIEYYARKLGLTKRKMKIIDEKKEE